MLRPATSAKHHERGVTLIELVVAVAILAIASLAAFRSFDAARDTLGGQVPRILAREVALNRAAELRALGLDAGRALPERVEMGNRVWQIEQSERGTAGGLVETEIRARDGDGIGARLIVYVARTPNAGRGN